MANFPIVATRRVRSTPFTERVEAAGLSGYTVYNHMLLPTSFGELGDNYHHLKKFVQIWDVAVERQVELRGADAHKLAVMMSARDLTNAEPGRCYYAPMTDPQGGILNDPIALCLAPDRFWFSIADSDVLLWALGVAHGMRLDVEIIEPDVSPLAIQGPLADDLMAEVFGEGVRSLRFFRFDWFEWRGRKLVIARSGWSKQGGFEIYLNDSSLGVQLWDDLCAKGAPYNLQAGCPNYIERIESGLLSYGSDMTREDTPLEVGLDRYVNLDSHEFIGRGALLEQRENGLQKKLMGLHIDGPQMQPLAKPTDCLFGGERIGMLTSAVYSPAFSANLGFAMLDIAHTAVGTKIQLMHTGETREAEVCSIPFSS